RVGAALNDQHELVTTKTRQRVGASHNLPEAGGKLADHRIAHMMAVRVVALLEPINIELHEAKRLPFGIEPMQRLLQALIKKHTVWRVGKTVEVRLTVQAFFMPLA